MKRAFDLTIAAVGLLVLLPLFAVVALFAKLSSAGPVFFKHKRIGRNLRPFSVYKFRTMVVGASKQGLPITADNDPRVTRTGRFLRKTKIDELPQLINVLKGEMSFVGPRPEVEVYVQKYPEAFRKILASRPGITDPASIKFRNESLVLQNSDDVERFYVEEILPIKLRYNLEYLEKRSFLYDFYLIFRTVCSVISGR